MRALVTPTTLALGLMVISGCGDDNNPPPPDGGPDTGTMDGGAGRIEDLPVSEEVTLADLTAPVEAVQDTGGMWHIYGAELTDAMRAEGYLQASDRMGQMDFFRRGATGRTAEYAGSFDPSLIQDDADARWEGHLRNAMAILPTLTAEQRELLDAYTAGVNRYIQRLRDGEVFLPRVVSDLLSPASIIDWAPTDTLAIARLESASLSFDTTDDIRMTEGLELWTTSFDAASSDPRIARLAGAFHDFYPFRPARDVFIMDGFPNVGTDTGSRALRPPPRRHLPPVPVRMPPLPMLERALGFVDRTESRFQRYFGDATRGSNSWVVSGDKTASGNPLLANDPHLALTSPSLFWRAHVDTKRMGGEDISAAGQMLVGTPINILGFNENIAWGLTTHGYDVTDVYLEQITPGTGGAPDTVAFEGSQVPIETITETVTDDLGRAHEFTFERVPHHGLIIPDTRTPTEALSIRWTGNEPSNEAAAFFDLYRAHDIDEARSAIDSFEVGGQTFVVISRDGDIFYTSQVRLPVRDPRSLTYDPATQTGIAPCFVLPGDTGEHEWGENLSDRYIPHLLNPTRGFIATANGDSVGVTADDNPFNDDEYIGWNFSNGHRIARITERLTELTDAGGVTPEDMAAVQADTQSQYGRFYTPVIVEELGRALEEAASGGTHPDLTSAVADAGATMDRIGDVRDRLMAWSFETPAAVEGTPSADEIADSVATTIFNVAVGHLMRLSLDDEADWLADGTFDGNIQRGFFPERTMHFMMTAPDTMASYDASIGDSVLWDDISTDAVESRGDRVLRAFVAAVDWLTDQLGDDMDMWLWGRLHTLKLGAILPTEAVLGTDDLDIPNSHDPMFPDGFPRHGDRNAVDASNFSDFAVDSFSYGSGPQQRLVVEMTPDGPQASNALPGGESEDPDSPHFADQMDLWRHNRTEPVPFREDEVVAAAERRIRFVP